MTNYPSMNLHYNDLHLISFVSNWLILFLVQVPEFSFHPPVFLREQAPFITHSLSGVFVDFYQCLVNHLVKCFISFSSLYSGYKRKVSLMVLGLIFCILLFFISSLQKLV